MRKGERNKEMNHLTPVLNPPKICSLFSLGFFALGEKGEIMGGGGVKGYREGGKGGRNFRQISQGI